MRDATDLRVFFMDRKALFLIPLYQRKYAWQKKHCQRLFSDLIKVHKQGLQSHFFGSIVSVRASETENDLLIIDGQQRITTISLLILAAINAVLNGQLECNSEDFVNDVKEHYLRSKYSRTDRKIKLRPIDDDLKAYDALFSNDEDEFVAAEQSGITSNYKFFYNLITDSGFNLSFDDLISAIEKLIIIDIRLESKDNPQLIFESLNSCGKDLEEADKVRNYLLMSLTKEEQEEYYYAYWKKIEKATDGEPTMFIRDYLTIKLKTISNIDDLYFDFKRYDESNAIVRKDLLEDMLKFARYYRMALKGETGKQKIDRKLKQLASIGSAVCLPFYMSFFDYAQQEGLSNEIQYEVLDVVENYWARRIICSLPANVMARTFASLHSDILRIYGLHEKRNKPIDVSYAEVLKHVLLKKQGTGEFPVDSKVISAFPQRQVYKIYPTYRAFLLERMENLNSKEYDEQIIEKINKGKITIEHIMPQHLTPAWCSGLGDKAEEIHQQYLHTFANLTLTGYNQEYSNRPYIEKWTGYTIQEKNKETGVLTEVQINGYKDSAFKLSNYLKLHQQWTETELKERGELLLKNFLSLWPMITTAYCPLEKEVEIVTLDDEDTELTGRQIVGYNLNGQRHEVSNWKEMIVDVCKNLYKEYGSDMLYLATKDYYFHEKSGSNRTQISEKCYVWTWSSTKDKRATLLYLFSELGIPASTLELVIQPLNDAINATEE